MKYSLLVLPFLAASAWGQAEDVYKNLSLGDRVQITFRSGGTITGNLDVNPVGQKPKPKVEGAPEEPVDFTKETGLTINLSWEYPGLDGTMTILKKEIKEVKKLQTLDKETMDRLKKQKAQIHKDLEIQNAQNKADAKKRDKEAHAAADKMNAKDKADLDATTKAADEARQKKEAEEALKLLQKFPPDAGWGPKKLEEIQQKSTRKNSVITPDETDFMKNYQQWVKAKDALAKPPGNN
jgi:hypothetical protein